MSNNVMLLIIGNGFDINHKLKTKYSDFREYVIRNKGILKDMFFPPLVIDNEDRVSYAVILQEIFDRQCGNQWNDFENSLGQLTYKILPHIKKLHSKFHIWRYRKEYELRSINLLRDDLYNFHRLLEVDLGQIFTDWITHVDFINFELKPKIINIVQDVDFVISFNYTDTLEQKYGLSKEKIIHLHGRVGEKIIFGHGRSVYELLSGTRGIEFDFQSKIANLRKPVPEIICKNRKHFERCNGIKKVYCLGFSFSDIDKPYITEMCKYLDDKVVWYQDEYNRDGQLEAKMDMIRQCGFRGKIEKFQFA